MKLLLYGAANQEVRDVDKPETEIPAGSTREKEAKNFRSFAEEDQA